LSEHANLALSLSSQLLAAIIQLLDLTLHSVTFIAGNLELVLQLAQSSSGKTKVFLGASHFLIKAVVLSKKLLDTRLVSLGFLSGGSKAVPEIIHFCADFRELSRGKSEAFLVLLNLASQ
jgi:hypothetical protein